MKDHFNEESSSDLSFTNSFGSDKLPNVDFSVTEKPKDDRTVSTSGEAFVIPESLRISGFRIVRLLGRGGMGVVYEAIEEELNRRVALKVLPASALLDSKQISRFKHEARAVAQLHHENIVPIYKVGSDQGIHYYTMQLIEGQNLSQVISSIKNHIKNDTKSSREDTKRRSTTKTKEDRKKEDRSPGIGPGSSSRRRFKIEELASALSSRRGSGHDLSMYQSIAEFGAEIATALSHAHEHGVIHRDIKPSNILVDETSKPWVADFGLAMVRENSVATKPGDIVGTYRYMSPEQATGRRFLIDHRTDIYSLGVTLYELVTQSVPFPGTEPHELLRQVSFDEPKSVRSANPAIPEELQIIITKAIAKNPHDRYETAHDFADDLRRFATGRPIQAKRASVVKQLRRWLGRHQGFVFAASLVLLMTFITSIAASAMIWNAYESEHNQLVIAEEALDRSEGALLGVKAQQLIPKNPGLALPLAVEGAKRAPGPEINTTMLEALAATYERKTLYPKDFVGKSLELSSDGRLAAGLLESKDENSRSVMVLNVEKGEVEQKLTVQSSASDLIFHPNSNYLVTASSTGLQAGLNGPSSHRSQNAILWDIRKADAKVVLFESTPMYLDGNCFSRDGRLLVLPSSDNSVSIYDGLTGERKVVFQQHEAQVVFAALNAKGDRAVSLDVQGELLVWETSEGDLIGKVSTKITMQAQLRLKVTADGNHAMISTSEGTSCFSLSELPLAKVAKWREPQLAVHPNQAIGACYWTSSNHLQIRDLTSGKALTDVTLSNAPSSISYSSDGRFLIVTVGRDISVMEPHTGKEHFALRGHSDLILAAAADDAFRTVVTTSQDRSLRVWATTSLLDMNQYPLRPVVPIPTRDHLVSTDSSIGFASEALDESAAIDANSSRLRRIGPGKHSEGSFDSKSVVLFHDQYVRVFDTATSRKIAEVAFPNSKVLEAVRCGDSDLVMVQLFNDEWFIWNTSNKSIRRFHDGLNQLSRRAMSPDGRQIVLVGGDGLCTVHSIPDGKVIRELPHDDLVKAVAWSNARGIFTLDAKSVLRRWDTSKESATPTWAVNASNANVLTIHDPSDQVITYHGWQSQEVSAWGIETGDRKGVVQGMERMKLVAHPTSPLILLTSMVQGSKLWDLRDGSLVDLSKNRSLSGLFIDEGIVVAEVGVEKHAHNHPTFFRSDSGTCALVYFDINTKQVLRSTPLNRKPIQLCLDPESQTLLLSYSSWHAVLYDRKIATEFLSPGFASSVSSIRHVAQNNCWLVASTDGTAVLLDSAGATIRTFVAEGAPIITAALSRDGSKCAFGTLLGGLQVFETDSGKLIHSVDGHQGAVRQIEFIENNSALLSLGADGVILKSSLNSKPSLQYANGLGIHSFTTWKDQTKTLLIIQSDKLMKPSGDGSSSIGSSESYSQVGNAKVLDLTTFIATEVFPEPVIAGDVNLDDGRLALLTEKGSVIIADGDSYRPLNQWDVSPRRLISLRWIDKNRLASLSDEAAIAVWEVNQAEMLMEIASPINLLGKQLSFREQWNPIDNDHRHLLGLGKLNKLNAYPLDVLEFTQNLLPRTLDAEEAKLYLTPLYQKRELR